MIFNKIIKKFNEEKLTVQDIAKCMLVGRAIGIIVAIIVSIVCVIIW